MGVSTGLGRARVGALAAATVVVLAGALVPQSASAYWSATTAVPSSGAASAATVNRGSTPVATVATQNDITVRWDASTLSNAVAASAYTVTRYNASGVSQTVLNGCAGSLTATVCTETDVPDGLWTYAITPRFAANWVGALSASSAAVWADTVAPANALSRTAVSGNSFLNGSTLYYRGVAAGSFTITNAVTDAASGPASSSTSALGGTTTGWTHSPSTVSTPTGGPFVSNAFSWTAGTTTQPTEAVTGRDANGNSAVSTLSFALDNTGPTGGAISYADGYVTTGSTNVTVQSISDSGADLSSGGGRWIQARTASMVTNGCGTFGSWNDLVTNPAVSPSTNSIALTNGLCYQFQYRFTDNLGNQTITTSTNVVRAKSYRRYVEATGGLLNYYRMGDTDTTLTDRFGTNSGTYTGGPTYSAAGAIVGDANTAVTFDGADDFGRVTRTIGNDFSIEFWFKSTQGLGTGSNWYNGAGLIDADSTTSRSDFGVALMADGRVAAGTGNTDTTVFSAAGKNDGAWHHVVMTRTQANGAIRLYVDGTLSASGTGGTQALTTTANIDFGRAQTGTNYFAGTLDEVAFYSTALSATDVANHNAFGRY